MRKLSHATLSLFVSTLPFTAHADDTLLTPPEITAQAVEMLGKTISIESVEGKGNVPAVADYLAAELRKGGFAAEDILIERDGDSLQPIRGPATRSRSSSPLIWMWSAPTRKTGRATLSR